MSGKNQFPSTLNWQSTNPQTNFRPVNNQSGSTPSGVLTGTMSGTNTIYTNIIDVSKMDNLGLEISWTGTPTGSFSYICSDSGSFFFPINITTANPMGTAGGFGVNLNQLPYKYFMVSYTNVSGAGTLSIYTQQKDLN